MRGCGGRIKVPGRIVLVGFGALGQGLLPLILKHLEVRPAQISVIAHSPAGQAVASEYGVEFNVVTVTRENFRGLLGPRLGPGDFLVNVANAVSSVALIDLCQSLGALYIDTCIEPWADGYVNATITPRLRTNYAMREAVLARCAGRGGARGPTAVLTHGANPGLVSHLVKQALLDIARDTKLEFTPPASRADWANLGCALGVKVIHVAERDTQMACPRKAPGEFVNTWSVDGFAAEGRQPAEFGWGSHESRFPHDGKRHEQGCRAAIYLNRPGLATRVRSWTPLAGPLHAFLVTHGESISIADYLTLGPPDAPRYRPTVCYAYHPCDDALLSIHELSGRNWILGKCKRVVVDEIVSGMDELGVLLMGHAKGAYWYGSRLEIGEARRLCAHNNATTLQVNAAVVAGMAWALGNPREGIVEPEALPHEFVLEFTRPYLGELAGVYSSWTPLDGRGVLFSEDMDASDPWQFGNFRVA